MKYVIFFLIMFILPSILNGIFQKNSIGFFVIIIIFLLIALNVNEILKFRLKLRSFYIGYIILIWFFLAPIFTPFNFIYLDFYLTIFAIFVFLIFSLKIYKEFAILSEVKVSRVLHVTFLWFTIIAIFSLVFNKLETRLFGLNFFPFQEPAHLARFYGPILIMTMFISIKLVAKIISVSITVILSSLFPSLSLLTYSVIAALTLVLTEVKLNVKLFLLFFFIFIFTISFFSQSHYFIERIQSKENANNHTTFFFWQGVEAAKISLLETNFIGTGLRQLGNEPANKFSDLMIEGMDRKSGGFVGAKLIAELGILGILIIISYTLIIFKCLKILINNSIERQVKIAAAAIIAVAPEIFLRGGGYFSPSLLLAISSIIFLKSKKNVSGSNINANKSF
jgi:hypothetical protein